MARYWTYLAAAAAFWTFAGAPANAETALQARAPKPPLTPSKPVPIPVPSALRDLIDIRNGHVVRRATVVNGLKVDRFTWLDSKRRMRSVSLKRQGEGNPGNGGYAVQMTYQYLDGSVWKTAVVNPQTTETPLQGFGYFVGHERFRNFTDGTTATIAGKIFGADDSPLGLGFPVTSLDVVSSYAGRKGIQYRLNYPKYGTIDARPLDANGQDSPGLPLAKSYYRLYQLPVRITWYFQSGRDFPRIKTQVSLENVPGPDRVSFDMRGPYGAMDFDETLSAPIMRVTWTDRASFASDLARNKPLTRNSTWHWGGPVIGTRTGRFSSLATATAEMGLVEPRVYAFTHTQDGYSGARGGGMAEYNNNRGCVAQNQKLPCDYEWPYQSAQYSLPYNNPNASTNGRKLAWGTAPFYGMSIKTIYDSPTTSQSFVGFPASKQLLYEVCVILAKNYNQDGFGRFSRSGSAALDGGTYFERGTSNDGGTYSCATNQLQKFVVIPIPFPKP